MQKNKIECKMTLRNEEPHVNKGFPRARGDVPPVNGLGQVYKGFSPRTRGCSEFIDAASRFMEVFPAHAGMFRVRYLP